ncbi:MAG: hypothetical protein JSS36_01480 [Proteobacteria bacterium]|nr:hypothetical protein [Pseudomonadota bacterium]
MVLALALAALPGVVKAQAQPAAKPAEAPKPPEGSVGGMGDINLYPKRVVIDARNRVASIGLYNRATSTGDYDITLGDMMMQGDGRLVDLASVADPAARARVKAASGFLRWSPHRVTLPGSEAQMVRVMAHLPPDLPPGEYRAHFSAIAVPPDGAGLTIEQAAGQQQANGVGVRIVPRFGISIPVIVRVGETTLTTGLTGLAVVTQPGGGKALALTITRQGTRSAFGDIVISAAGAKAPLAEVRGIGVYPEIDARQVQIPIAAGTDPKLYAPGARLTVTYTDDDFAPGKVLARQEFTVP